MTDGAARPRHMWHPLGRRGVATVEFAIIGLLLMTWVFGIMEVARAYWTYEIMEEVAIEASRCIGLLAPGCSSAGAYSSNAATAHIISLASTRGLALTAANLNLQRPASCAGTPGFAVVTISYTFNTAVPALVPALKSIPLSSRTCFFNVQ